MTGNTSYLLRSNHQGVDEMLSRRFAARLATTVSPTWPCRKKSGSAPEMAHALSGEGNPEFATTTKVAGARTLSFIGKTAKAADRQSRLAWDCFGIFFAFSLAPVRSCWSWGPGPHQRPVVVIPAGVRLLCRRSEARFAGRYDPVLTEGCRSARAERSVSAFRHRHERAARPPDIRPF